MLARLRVESYNYWHEADGVRPDQRGQLCGGTMKKTITGDPVVSQLHRLRRQFWKQAAEDPAQLWEQIAHRAAAAQRRVKPLRASEMRSTKKR